MSHVCVTCIVALGRKGSNLSFAVHRTRYRTRCSHTKANKQLPPRTLRIGYVFKMRPLWMLFCQSVMASIGCMPHHWRSGQPLLLSVSDVDVWHHVCCSILYAHLCHSYIQTLRCNSGSRFFPTNSIFCAYCK